MRRPRRAAPLLLGGLLTALVTVSPATATPAAAHPAAAHPTTAHPATASPTTAHPVAVTPSAAVTPSPSPSSSPEAPEADLPLRLAVDDLLPRAPRPGDPLQVLGTLTNEGPEPVRGLQLRVRVGERLATRGQLAEADREPPSYGAVRATVVLPDLEPGGSVPVDARLPVDDLRLGDDGVYPLLLEVRGLAGADRGRQQLAAVATYLPWFGDTAVDPLRIAWLVPLVDQPRRGPRDVLLDDELATTLSAQGRLGRLLTAASAGSAAPCDPAALPADGQASAPAPTCSPVPLTWAVDPDLLSTAELMAGPYEVAARDGSTVPGAGGAAATAFLAAARAAAGSGAVLALPYADPDVVALTRAAAGLSADVATARSYGVTVTRELLGVDPLPDVALPPDGTLTDAAFDALTTSPTRALVLGQDALDVPEGPSSSTPGSRVALPSSSTSGPVDGLVPDEGLAALLLPEAVEAAGVRLAEQRFLVETAMIAAERPNRGRTLVVALPRRAEPDPALLSAAVADTGRVPWACAVPLADVVRTAEACAGRPAPSYDAEREAALRQDASRADELDPALLTRLRGVRADAEQFTGAVVKGGTEQAQATRARMQRAWLRAESSAWREQRSTGARLLGLLADDVAGQRAKVKVLTGSVTLTSRNGRVSVLVVNELDQPVTVAIRLQAPADARLSRTQSAALEIPARNSQSVDVNAQTLTSGRFVVLAQLVDRDGRDLGAPSELLVRSTRYGTVALAVTGLGCAVLLAAAGVRVARRALRRS